MSSDHRRHAQRHHKRQQLPQAGSRMDSFTALGLSDVHDRCARLLRNRLRIDKRRRRDARAFVGACAVPSPPAQGRRGCATTSTTSQAFRIPMTSTSRTAPAPLAKPSGCRSPRPTAAPRRRRSLTSGNPTYHSQSSRSSWACRYWVWAPVRPMEHQPPRLPSATRAPRMGAGTAGTVMRAATTNTVVQDTTAGRGHPGGDRGALQCLCGGRRRPGLRHGSAPVHNPDAPFVCGLGDPRTCTTPGRASASTPRAR
jgi:hypothetical protein